MHERQYLPLRRVSEYRGRDPIRAAAASMNAFSFARAATVQDALRESGGGAKFVAGGTTLIDLMKLDVETPLKLVDINRLPLKKIARTPENGLRIGALARNSDVAHHPDIVRDYPVLSEALLSGASAQLRNMASTAGNLLQRTRCVYFRDIAYACNKRSPGSGCPAITGFNRNLAILGTSEHCIASNPSDQNVALTALEATVQIASAHGERNIPVDKFFLLPGDTPDRETVLEAGELVTSVTLPPPAVPSRSTYLKLRDRASYEFALASAAVVATVNGGAFERVRIAMGGIGTKPWRSAEAEAALEGMPATAESFEKAAQLIIREARPQAGNEFKVELAKRCLVYALSLVTKTEQGEDA
jgi:xanthine dehydrogenase YagS FAD-binding subunit